jgi:drug/metabolite transporter (DMT)-like permease
VSPRSGLILLVLANLAWAASYPLTTVALADFPPAFLTLVRLAVGALLLCPWLFEARGRLTWSALGWSALLGEVGFALPIFLQTAGVGVSNPALGAMSVALEPLLTALFASLFLREPLPPRRRVALGLAFVGTWAIAGFPLPGHAGLLAGDALLVLAAACFAFYNVFSRRLTDRLPFAAAASATLLFGLIGTLPIWVLAGAAVPHAVHLPSLAAAAFLALVATGVGYAVWMLVLSRLAVATAALFLYLQPVFGVLLSFWIVGTRPGLPFVVGSILILAALWLGREEAPAAA